MSIILGVILPFIWIFYFFRKDKHPEPAIWLFISFLLGIISAILSYFSEGSFVFLKSQNEIAYFLLSAFIEEFFKFLVIWLLVFPQRVFDEPVDAMIYMMFSALGFSVFENFFVLISPHAEGKILFISFYRFLGANFLHILASALIGYGYGLKMLTQRSYPFILTFFAAIILHFIYNFVILNSGLGFLYILPLLWAVFLVVLSELNYLVLKHDRERTTN